ncbi:hypothetical protein [Luedemannella helvata]|uniref:Uncharacterized protein n=1 Tax=Luedemannella helvata TaxID=349315 RepID=A0ABP4WE87_9ACTN
MTTQLLVEGVEAVEATRELATIDGLVLDWRIQKSAEPEKIMETVTVIATIAGVAGSAVTIADQIVKWRERWKARGRPGQEKAIEKVIINIDNRRILLDPMSAAEIAKLLADPSRPDRPA